MWGWKAKVPPSSAALLNGTLVSRLTARIDDHLIEITLTTILAYGTFMAAEALGVSGVIAVVVAMACQRTVTLNASAMMSWKAGCPAYGHEMSMVWYSLAMKRTRR